MGLNPCEIKEMDENEAYSFAMEIVSGSILPMVLTTVIKLDVLEIMKRAGPGVQLTATQIAAQLPTKNSNAATMLDRMLRLLASHSVLSCSHETIEPSGVVERRYGLLPVCKFLTKNEDGATLGALSLFVQDKIIMDTWYNLEDAILSGELPFKKMYGMLPFEYFGINSRFNKIFNNAMEDQSTITLKKLLENYNGFDGLSTLVDIGGGNGSTLRMIIWKYPSIRGINFDLPHVIANAPSYPGVEHVEGDMFESVPKADAMIMKLILHGWSDQQCIKVLKNCHAALANHGKLIVCESILPVAPDTSHAARAVFQFDVLMLTNCLGGKERTEQEFKDLAKEAGFGGFRVACSAYDFKVMEFLKIY